MYAIIYVLVFACMPWARALRRALDTKHGALDTEHPTDTHVECPLGSTPSKSKVWNHASSKNLESKYG